MAKKNKKSYIRRKLLHKYRLVVLNEDTFEERLSFKLNRLNIFVFSTASAILLIVLTTLLIAFTPLKELIPGYSSTALQKKATDLTFKTDSLSNIIAINDQYIASIKKVLTGDLKTVDFNKDSIIEEANRDPENVRLAASREDSLLREKVAQEDKYNPLIEDEEVDMAFFAPVKGTISEGYNPKEKHYAVDIATIKDAPIKSIADGTVVFVGWTLDTGYVLIIKHPNNLLSVYKHNSTLTKEQGDFVKGGEVVAKAGNTGELTTGPHLHFELWLNGNPIDPTNSIDFN